jgi:hypothetical protein
MAGLLVALLEPVPGLLDRHHLLGRILGAPCRAGAAAALAASRGC